MQIIRQFPLIIFMALTFMANPANALSFENKQSTFKSYREWKTEKVAEIQNRIQNLSLQKDLIKRSKVLASKTEAGLTIETQVENIDRQLRQESMKMSLAQDLSVSDYFVGYLTKVDNKGAAIKEISGRLSAEEVAELMNAYANSVFGTQNQDRPSAIPAAMHIEPAIK
ncbi:MAG: hypothetical protein ACLGGX_00480 [Bdellovibrionia bacterium]